VYRYHVDAALSSQDFETVSARRFLSCAFALFPERYGRSGSFVFVGSRVRDYKQTHDKTFIA